MTDYRDDREALNERVTTLQQELDGARTDLERERAKGTRDERVEALSSEIGSAKERLAAMEIELRALRGDRPPSAAGAPQKNRAAFVLAGAAVAGAVMVALIVRSPSQVGPSRPSVTTAAVATTAAKPIAVPTVAPPALPTMTPTLAASAAAEEPRAVKATWPARVRLSTGSPSAVGSTCTIEGDVSERGLQPWLRGMVVRCGERVVYDSKQQTAGMRQTRGGARQFIGPERGSLVFDATYDDTGTGDMPQVRIDGTKGTASIWHDYPDAFRLELTFARASSPVMAEPLGTLGRAVLDRSARVRQVRGRGAPAVGALCRLRAMPVTERSCYVAVDCGAAGALFGGVPFSATTNCNADAVLAGKATILDLDDPNSSNDGTADGDPRLHLFTPADGAPSNSARDVLTVADEPKNAAPWSVELILAEPPRADAGADAK